MGNVEFEGDQDSCKIKSTATSTKAVENVSRLLQCDRASLSQALENKLLVSRERTWTPLGMKKVGGTCSCDE